MATAAVASTKMPTEDQPNVNETSNNRVVTVAATQMSCSTNTEENLKKGESLVRIAASRGAQIVVLQELLQHPYLSVGIDQSKFDLAESLESSSVIKRMSVLAKELQVVLPISFFEVKNNHYYNSIAIIDADGSILGTYRGSHLATRFGFNDNFYFTRSNESPTVYKTQYGTIGVALSSDQWFPEVARVMALQGAELLIYSSGMGSDALDTSTDSKDHWHRVVQGHAAANGIPVISSNRVGKEENTTFYGSSFITGPTGEMLKVADRESEGVLVESFNLSALKSRRAAFGLLRDRNPSISSHLATL